MAAPALTPSADVLPDAKGRDMELRDLRAFVTIARVGTLSGAARELDVTQPALSALVRRLEEAMGVKVVRRQSRGIALTDEGWLLLDWAHTILHDVEAATEAVRGSGGAEAGTVHIGLPPAVCAGLVPPFFERLGRCAPGIEVHLSESLGTRLAEELQLGRLDVAILFDVQPMPGLHVEPILIEEPHLVVASDHQVATRRIVGLAELAEMALVLPSADQLLGRLVEGAAASRGILLAPAHRIDSLSATVALAKAGYATILPAFAVREEIAAGLLSAVRIVDPVLEWTPHLAMRRDLANPRGAMVVGRLLVETALALVRDGAWEGRAHARYRPPSDPAQPVNDAPAV
ncbi:LysR family transcriptional regulator [Acuticoccus mangrovi]|uniref:LysR family transcriptional regulator n=1 Tax=Acuticoccus mangrovi TaxID=2796142 RepID=A0A934IN96_9HYPH|nr:LysR substrate-binding domain-containing protein [Acuticoccus mangrovi]MBJ3774519.1 LysR family transcriptional regulator [Acuticoccus mangrovi]